MKQHRITVVMLALSLYLSLQGPLAIARDSTALRNLQPVEESVPLRPGQSGDLERDTDFLVRLSSPLSTKLNKKGDSVAAEVLSPSAYRGYIMEGVVKESKSGGSIKGHSVLTFTFEKLIRGDHVIAIRSSIKSFKNSKGKEMVDEAGNVVEKKNNVGSAVAGAAAGAALGAILGGAKGAGVGAGVGAV